MKSEIAKRLFPVPPATDEYIQGFETVRDRLSDDQIRILRAHYEAPGYRATVHDLARVCGIGSWRTVNRQYGEIAKLVLTAMGYEKPKSETISLWLIGLVVGFDYMEMILRPEVAKALVKARIVKEKSNESQPPDESLTDSDDLTARRRLKTAKAAERARIPNDHPSADELVHAFERVRDRITRDQMAMLVMNYVSQDRGVTVWELSQVCGSDIPDPKIGWSIYRDFAGTVYREMGYSDEDLEALKRSLWDLLLADARPHDGQLVGNYGVVLVMRPEVAEALERLRIVDTPK